MKENRIVIDGVSHILVKDRRKNDFECAVDCSLYDMCTKLCREDTNFCRTLFGEEQHHFTKEKQESVETVPEIEKIEQLKLVPIFNTDDKGIQELVSYRSPTHVEMMDKINEIIMYINNQNV